ncbi:hypothetical protein MUY27_11370 [Mucilaginibacter sp. RS28]|uniref:Phenylalanyl-tRNA synthetase subunit beta n=1 Tax=Mucilaginibacter straminoryzae TaxID=2932774 RepID=A0A9X1X377_9SPHI|nr:hypothetical protein [Mucilaginibacter straminoryzae]MCJ8210309.1 hypothetical protein [Mucilaginibacter straminoryzae]
MTLAEQLTAVTKKTERLIALCDALQQENALLKQQQELLNTSISDSNGKIAELEEKVRVLKLAKSVADTGEKTLDIKQKINEFVREIDKCIVLLKK